MASATVLSNILPHDTLQMFKDIKSLRYGRAVLLATIRCFLKGMLCMKA